MSAQKGQSGPIVRTTPSVENVETQFFAEVVMTPLL